MQALYQGGIHLHIHTFSIYVYVTTSEVESAIPL